MNGAALRARLTSLNRLPRNKPTRKPHPRNPRTRRKRPTTSGPGKTSRQMTRTVRKMRLLLKLLKLKSIFGVRIIIMEQECGPSTTQTIVRAAQGPTEQRQTLTSLPSTQWTATPNDCCARINASLGSG